MRIVSFSGKESEQCCHFNFFSFSFFNVTKIHTRGTPGHAALVHLTFHKSSKHEMNEHTGNERYGKYISKDYVGMRLYTGLILLFLWDSSLCDVF